MARRVVVTPYDPRWPEAYDAEAKRLRAILEPEIIAIEHIGSTAVPGMSAKPIIDVLIAVRDIVAVDAYNECMSAAGYEAKGENGIPGRRYFRRGTPDVHLAHVHCFQQPCDDIVRHLAFRDYMIGHPQEAAAYSTLKQDLARRHPFDIDAYIEGKAPFVQAAEQRALAWYRSRDAGTNEPAPRQFE